MRISVITVSYNSATTIQETIESVLAQQGVELEQIVIDGGSSDGTMALLGSYRDRLAYCVSEPDEGMYDAMNKGIARATGDVVAILNSDDVYANSEVLAKASAKFEESGTDIVYGDLNYVAHDDLDKVVRFWKSGEYCEGSFRRGWHPPHPSFFVRRSIYEQLGGFNLALRIAADYEFMLRVLEKHQCSVAYIPEVLVKMRAGGESNASLKNILKANRECARAWRINGYSSLLSFWAVARKLLSKLKQIRF